MQVNWFPVADGACPVPPVSIDCFPADTEFPEMAGWMPNGGADESSRRQFISRSETATFRFERAPLHTMCGHQHCTTGPNTGTAAIPS